MSNAFFGVDTVSKLCYINKIIIHIVKIKIKTLNSTQTKFNKI